MTVLPHTIDSRRHPLERGEAPPWASGWGQDRYGVFAELRVKNQVQTFRWCPPGQFLMGSPDGEEGRQEEEGPRIRVTFTGGFWIMDTPVTQAFYDAITGDDPSQAVMKPVTNLTGAEIQDFITQLNGLICGLKVQLPSEAQWEYACRAGIRRRFSWGDSWDDTKAIWDWPTVVKSYDANPWGLYDMHGNVWEWCADVWHDSHEGANQNGFPRQASQKQITEEMFVIRGGSFSDRGENCRSAARLGFTPEERHQKIGFRLIQG